jgi:chromosome segregation ATPase
MRLPHPAVLAGVLAIVLGSVIAGQQQQQQPSSPSDVVSELRALRGDLRATLQTQLLAARLTRQEGRILTLSQQLTSVRQQMFESEMALLPYAGQLKQAQETNSEIFAPLRAAIEQVQKRVDELRTQENDLGQRLTSEEQRWTDFNERLNEIERMLSSQIQR